MLNPLPEHINPNDFSLVKCHNCGWNYSVEIKKDNNYCIHCHTVYNSNIKINQNEKKVLFQLYNSSKGNGHDFGYSDNIEVDELTQSQISGYISSLYDKGLFIFNYEKGHTKTFEFKNLDLIKNLLEID